MSCTSVQVTSSHVQVTSSHVQVTSSHVQATVSGVQVTASHSVWLQVSCLITFPSLLQVFNLVVFELQKKLTYSTNFECWFSCTNWTLMLKAGQLWLAETEWGWCLCSCLFIFTEGVHGDKQEVIIFLSSSWTLSLSSSSHVSVLCFFFFLAELPSPSSSSPITTKQTLC